jgi:eukaryotic-like serine/threonine-protein kinase
MPLSPATRLGPYEIIAAIGAGGMGEVYRARDTRLDRIVAVKVLSEHLSSNPQSRERFEREAKAISSLSHPHICPLYDVGREAGVDYLVMEYLEGETLASRLKKGALPPDHVLQYAIQITDALDTAHRHGVIHRDLKPGNIMLTKSGVKLLDFGLAKVRGVEAVAGMTALPTQTTPLTGEGTILGTLQYMAPEQLEGKDADARTDIFAFGAILYEMTTGRKAFEARSQASLIAAILEHDPTPIAIIQPLSPPMLDRTVKQCLAKGADERWQTAGDLKRELQWILEPASHGRLSAPVMAHHKNRERAAWIAAAICGIVSVVSTVGYLRRAPGYVEPARFSIFPPERASFNSSDSPIIISPDGRRVVFDVRDADGRSFLWLRSLDSLEAHKLDGTEGAYDAFWSPDGRFIAFGISTNGKLLKIDFLGGPPQTICDMIDGRGGAWNHDNVILFTKTGAGPLFRVSAYGGIPEQVTVLDRTRRDIAHWRPQFLPDGRHFLFSVKSELQQNSGLYVGSLDTKETKRVAAIDVTARFGQPGFLLFVRGRTLMAQPFDPNRIRVTGEPSPIANDVEYVSTWGAAAFSVSDNGVLTYQSGTVTNRQLIWFDRTGRRLDSLGEAGAYFADFRISPDGKRVAAARVNPETRSPDVWLFDVIRPIGSRLTFETSNEQAPVWSPDGTRVVFSSVREGVANLYQKSATGTANEEVLLKSESGKQPEDWSRDGRYLMYLSFDPKTKEDLWVLPLRDKKPAPLLNTQFRESQGRFSPNSRWIAYTSDESGKQDVYVQPFPLTGAKWRISNKGGHNPIWSQRELFYQTLDYKWKVVAVQTDADFKPGEPKDLFDTPLSFGADITADGRRFLVNMPAPEAIQAPVTVVLNWAAELKR